MSGPTRQRRARQFSPYVGRQVTVLDRMGVIIVDGIMEYINSELTDRTGNNPGFYVGTFHIPLKSVVSRGGIASNRSIVVDKDYLQLTNNKGVNAA